MIVLCLLSACFAPQVFAQRLDRAGPTWEVTDAQWTALAERWREEGRPRIAVLVAEADANGNPQETTGTGELLASEMRSLLAGKLGPTAVMQADQLDALQQRRADRLVLSAGGMDPRMAQEIQRQIDADLVFTIKLVNVAGQFQPVVEVVDNRNGSMLASPTANAIDPRQDRWPLVYANAFIKQFIEKFADETRGPPVYLFDVYLAGFETFNDADAALDAVEDALDDADDLQVDYEVLPLGEDNFACTLKISYQGDRAERVLRTLGRAFDEQWEGEYVVAPAERSRFRFSALVYPDEAPDWYLATDTDSPDFIADSDRRAQVVRDAAGGLRLGILVGRGIAEDWPQLEIQGVEETGEDLPFAPAELRTALQDQFAQMGFDVRDDAAVRDRIQQLARQMDRRGVSAINAEALADIDAFDLLAVVALNQDDQGNVRINARLISRADARMLGGVVGPGLAETRPGEFRVRPERVDSMARYVTGTLVGRFDRHAARLGRTVDVTLANLDSAAQLDQIRKVLLDCPGVSKVGRIGLALPSGTLEISTTGPDVADLALQIERGLTGLDFTPVVASATPTSLFIDANPGLNNAPPTEEELIRRINAYPDLIPAFQYTTPAPPEPQVVNPPQSQPQPGPSEGPAQTYSQRAKPRPEAWALLIGVNEAKGQHPLNGAVGDAQRLGSALMQHAGFPANQVVVMTDGPESSPLNPTTQHIIEQLKAILQKARAANPSRPPLIVFFLSSHGGSRANGNTALCTRDGTIDLEVLREALAGVSDIESLFIIDVCHAGGPNDAAIVDELQSNVQTTLASCRRNQSSIEATFGQPPVPQGVFTSCLIAGLIDGNANRGYGDGNNQLDVFELYKFTYDKVSTLTEDSQNPFLKTVAGTVPILVEYE